MKVTGHTGFSVFLILIGSYVAYVASGWSFKTGFFPLAVSIPLIVLAATHLFLELFGGPENGGGPAVEAEFSQAVRPDVARRRAFAVFSWIAGFIALVALIGFPLAVPLFVFLYLKIQSRVSWTQTAGLTAATWLAFHLLFQRLVQLQFEDGMIQTWLGV